MVMFIYNKLSSIALICSMMFISCTDFLEQEPPSYITPEGFFNNEDKVLAAANQFYTDILPSHGGWDYGLYASDNQTDNQASLTPDSKFAVGLWKTGNDNGNWNWANIRNLNYQLNKILEAYEAGEISGVDANIRQYIGEIYFFRAYSYFNMLQMFGDLPIVTEDLPDNEQVLTEVSKRMPRNEVARFIINNLDTAITYMQDDFETRHTRVSKDVAYLFKSRVALFEASWLTNFANTPFVPLGEGWPGKSKDYNAGYKYPTGSIEEEAKFFFEQAVGASEIVAEKYKTMLVTNTGTIPQSVDDPENPYFSLWGTTDMSKTPEILLWREYSKNLGITNCVEVAIQYGDYGIGVTRSLVEGYLMEDGRPLYASTYEYSDQTISEVATNRDPRLTIFLKVPGQKNVFKNMDVLVEGTFIETEPYPNIIAKEVEHSYPTGYAIRKGGTFDKSLTINGQCYNAACIFRATEALLNYMEAKYMLTKDLNAGRILEYWKIVREKAGFKGEAVNPQVTIEATDMAREKRDWGAYTAGMLLTDKILYNIRRERRCELISEGFRNFDLIRWRSFDQLMTEPVHVEGIHLYNTPMENWYENLVYDGTASATVSSPTASEYLRPHEVNLVNNSFKDGLTWCMAHYLQPLPLKQFLLTASDHKTYELSPLYQNPYWPLKPDSPAEK